MPAGDLVRPFAGVRAAPDRAAEIAAPPYDVVTVEEARAAAAAHPLSFLRVSRAEVDLPAGTDPYSDAVYAAAARRMGELEASGALIRDPTPRYYVYRMTRGDHVQTGLVASASLDAYAANRIRRHELTRPDKELDRVRQIAAVNAITGPVLLVHRPDAGLSALLRKAATGAPDAVAPDVDGVRHELWTVADGRAIAKMSGILNSMDALYIADGHHRSAAAARVLEGPGGADGYRGFLAVSFPADEVNVLGYHRMVSDLAGRTAEEFLASLSESFRVQRAGSPVRPAAPSSFGMCLAGDWYRIEPEAAASGGGPQDRLDVSVLSRLVLEPLLGIHDLRTDPRIHFAGGEGGVADIGAEVGSGRAAVGFTLHPTAMEEVMAVADAHLTMPPKSTWFDPKLADGLISQPLGQR